MKEDILIYNFLVNQYLFDLFIKSMVSLDLFSVDVRKLISGDLINLERV